MFSKPKLGVNTAVYGQVPFAELLDDVVALAVDGMIAKLGPMLPLERLAEPLPLPLFGIELAAYRLGQLPVNIEDIVQVSRAVNGRNLILPLPELDSPATVQDAIQYVADVQRLAETAVEHEQAVVVPVVNRYESTLLNTIEQAENFLKQVDRPNVRLMLSTFDLNIEAQDGAGQLARLGERLAFLQMSDSHHGPIGEGNIKLATYLWAVQEMTHEMPILLDVKRPFVSPFSPELPDETVQTLLERSRRWF